MLGHLVGQAPDLREVGQVAGDQDRVAGKRVDHGPAALGAPGVDEDAVALVEQPSGGGQPDPVSGAGQADGGHQPILPAGSDTGPPAQGSLPGQPAAAVSRP